MSRLQKLIVVSLIVASCIGCDRVSKVIVLDHLGERSSVEMAGGMVFLTYAENAGAFLGMGESLGAVWRWVLLVLCVGALMAGIAVYLWRSTRLSRLEVVGFAMILGGGLANLAERAAHGFVRDVVQLRLGPLHTGVFNLADTAITTGVVMIVLFSILERRRSPAA